MAVPLYTWCKFVKMGRQTNLTEQTHFSLRGQLPIMKLNIANFYFFKQNPISYDAHYFILWNFPSIYSLENG